MPIQPFAHWHVYKYKGYTCILHETSLELNGGSRNTPHLMGKNLGEEMEISSQSWLNLNLQNFQLGSRTTVHTLRLLVSRSTTNEVLETPVVQLGEDARALSPCHPQLQA